MLIHKASSRGFADHGWLKSAHTFSFADYYDPTRMSFGALRVINDDYVAPGAGFGMHPHRDMEIITVPLQGSLEHKDSEGNFGNITKSEVQMMSAGTGIRHSEFNASKTLPVELLQIWVMPKKLSIKPRYDQKKFDFSQKEILLVSNDGRKDSVSVNQDAFFTYLNLNSTESFDYKKHLESNGVYVFVIDGDISINDQRFNQRDGIGLNPHEKLSISGYSKSEILVMEIPM